MKIQIKKTIVVLLAILLATTLFVSMASAKTQTKDLPYRYEVLEFVGNWQGESDFVNTVSSESQSSNPSWLWDTWRDTDENRYISFYYKINDYKSRSIYFDDEGNVVKPGNWKLVESYKGT